MTAAVLAVKPTRRPVGLSTQRMPHSDQIRIMQMRNSFNVGLCGI